MTDRPGDGWPSGRSRHGGADEIPLPPGVGGRLWLCGKRFIAPDPEAAMGRVGATGAVCLNEASELVDRYPQYVAWLQANHPHRVLWWPIPDLHAPEVDEAADMLSELHRRLATGQALLMHCGAGIGRAGTMAAGVLMTMGLGLPEAVARVAEHRPMGGPEVGVQTDLLRTLAARYRPGADTDEVLRGHL